MNKIKNRIAMAGALLLLWMFALSQTAQGAFVHPGLLHTQADFDRMITQVTAGATPTINSWNILVANSHSSSSYTPNPQAVICAGGACAGLGLPENYGIMMNDAAAAYQNALRWKIAGTTANADAAVRIMNAWASTFQRFDGDSNAGLRCGLYGYQWANAAEIMRGYSGWAAADFTAFKNMLVNIFYPISSDFLIRHNGTCWDHYWVNWDFAAMNTILAIGVLTDDQAKYNEAVTYFKSGIGTGNIDHAVPFIYPGTPTLGQGEEAGRDQGHACLDISLVGAFCEMAYKQGDDLYAWNNNKVLALCEYTAQYNLFFNVPYTSYKLCDAASAMTVISSSGRGDIRPSWELIYNHYVVLKGLSAPNSQQYAANVRPEGGGGNYGTASGGFDQLGFGSLTCTINATTPPPQDPKLTGTWIGSPGSWGNFGNTGDKVFDNNLSTFYDALNASGDWTGLDLGATKTITSINYCPRATFSARMVGGVFQGASDAAFTSGVVTLFTITAAPPDGVLTRKDITSATFRYVRYLGAANMNCNVAEVEFHGTGGAPPPPPPAPTGLTATAASSSQINLSWTASSGATSYNVKRATVSGGPYTTIATGVTSASYSNTGLAASTTYYYVVSAVNAGGESPNSTQASATTVAGGGGIPPAPTGLSVTDDNNHAVLTWSASTGATSYKVKRATVSGGPYTVIATPTGTTYTDTTVVSGTYYYVVSAVNAVGESPNSAQVSYTPGG